MALATLRLAQFAREGKRAHIELEYDDVTLVVSRIKIVNPDNMKVWVEAQQRSGGQKTRLESIATGSKELAVATVGPNTLQLVWDAKRERFDNPFDMWYGSHR